MPPAAPAIPVPVRLYPQRSWPQDADVAALSKRVVSIDQPLPFGTSAADDLRLLRLLREATSNAVRLQWTLEGVPRFPLSAFAHLVPPLSGTSPASARLAREWAAAYRYGLFFFRNGPGFVSVKDVRPGQEMRRLTITDGAEHFMAMTQASCLHDLEAAARTVVADAVDADLALAADDSFLVLPYRMRHWPVPYVAI
jgi:hypothetical protein